MTSLNKRILLSEPTRFIIAFLCTLLFCLGVSSPNTSIAADSRPAWQAEGEKTVKAAEEEGTVVIYMTNAFEPVFREALRKKYPKIVLGLDKPEMEMKVQLLRPAGLRPDQRGADLFLQAPRSGAGVSPTVPRRYGYGHRALQRAVVGLDQRGKILVRYRREASRYGNDAGTAAQSISAGIAQRRILRDCV